MYLKYWKLACRPFDERLEPSWFFASAQHEGMRVKLRCVVKEREPVAILAGGLGTGKSMVARIVADRLAPDKHPAVCLPIAANSATDVLCEILNELHHGGAEAADSSVSSRLQTEVVANLQAQLARRAEAAQHPVVFVDAVDGIGESEFGSLIDNLRGLRVTRSAGLTTILIGSSQLLVWARRRGAMGAEPIPQFVLGSMAPADTAAYISHRLRLAGGDSSIFSPAAFDLIHDMSGGVPRRVNRLCDFCLLDGFAHDREQVGEGQVWNAQGELRLLSPTRTATAPATHRWRRFGRSSQQATIISDSAGHSVANS